jgi:uncharacterized membrane protein
VRRSAEAAGVGLLAAVFAVVAAVPEIPQPARAAAAVPLVLVLPGYALASAAFARFRLDPVERVLLTGALSLAAAALVALCLDVTPWGLRRTSWAIALAVVTVAATLVAAARGHGGALPLRAIRPTRAQAALLCCGAVLAGGAVWLAARPLPASGREGYTALWLLPAPRSTTVVRVGLRSGELRSTAYRLSLRLGNRVVRTWRLRLPTSGRWEAQVALPREAGAVVALLYRGPGDGVYRRAELHRGVG